MVLNLLNIQVPRKPGLKLKVNRSLWDSYHNICTQRRATVYLIHFAVCKRITYSQHFGCCHSTGLTGITALCSTAADCKQWECLHSDSGPSKALCNSLCILALKSPPHFKYSSIEADQVLHRKEVRFQMGITSSEEDISKFISLQKFTSELMEASASRSLLLHCL